MSDIAEATRPALSGPSFARVEAASNPSRRHVLGAGSLLLAFAVLGRSRAHAAGDQPGLLAIQNATGGGQTGAAFQGFAPGGFIRIAHDGTITLILPNVEMGQGIYTGQAALLAEEL